MNGTITMKLENTKSTDGKTYANMLLVGNTYAAKEIIKSIGWMFSSPVGKEKGWRSPIQEVEEMKANPDMMKNEIAKMKEALEAAGFKLVFSRR